MSFALRFSRSVVSTSHGNFSTTAKIQTQTPWIQNFKLLELHNSLHTPEKEVFNGLNRLCLHKTESKVVAASIVDTPTVVAAAEVLGDAFQKAKPIPLLDLRNTHHIPHLEPLIGLDQLYLRSSESHANMTTAFPQLTRDTTEAAKASSDIITTPPVEPTAAAAMIKASSEAMVTSLPHTTAEAVSVTAQTERPIRLMSKPSFEEVMSAAGDAVRCLTGNDSSEVNLNFFGYRRNY